jgi:protease IV
MTDFLNTTLSNSDKAEKHSRNWGLVLAVVVMFVILSIASFASYNSLFANRFKDSGQYDDQVYGCNVFGLNIHGTLVTYLSEDQTQTEDGTDEQNDMVASEDIVSLISQADKDENIKAIMLDVDSLGGYPVAGEEIARALRDVKKPTVAVIRQSGLSAAYWAATGADMIFASKNSDVGSIGVTMSYVRDIDPSKQYVELSSGKFKDTGDPEKNITPEEKSLLLRDVNITHQNFIEAVATNRGLSIERVKSIADGSSVLGEKAKELGLVNDIGSWKEAEEYLKSRIDEDPEICWQ